MDEICTRPDGAEPEDSTPSASERPVVDPDDTSEPAAGAPEEASAQLTDEVIELFASMRSSLQRWHDAYRRAHGGPASDPSRGQGRVLALLDMQGEMRQRDMGYILNIRPQSLGEVLAKLERAGLVSRRTSEKDRRVLLVSITDKGRACVSKRKVPFPAVDFTDDELKQFAGLLSRLVNAFEADAERMSKLASGTAPQPMDRIAEDGLYENDDILEDETA